MLIMYEFIQCADNIHFYGFLFCIKHIDLYVYLFLPNTQISPNNVLNIFIFILLREMTNLSIGVPPANHRFRHTNLGTLTNLDLRLVVPFSEFLPGVCGSIGPSSCKLGGSLAEATKFENIPRDIQGGI